jgi:hypothetical protein
MFNSKSAFSKVYAFDLKIESFANPATQVEKDPDEQTVPEIGGGLLRACYFVGFQIGSSHPSSPIIYFGFH